MARRRPGAAFFPVWAALLWNVLRLARSSLTVAAFWRKARSWLVIFGFFVMLAAFGAVFGGARGGTRMAGCVLLAVLVAAGFTFYWRYRRFAWLTGFFSTALWIPLLFWLSGQAADFVTTMVFMTYLSLPAYAALLGCYEAYAKIRKVKLARDETP
jgi:hypothetical protein